MVCERLSHPKINTATATTTLKVTISKEQNLSSGKGGNSLRHRGGTELGAETELWPKVTISAVSFQIVVAPSLKEALGNMQEHSVSLRHSYMLPSVS